jgi:hypothetical protein
MAVPSIQTILLPLHVADDATDNPLLPKKTVYGGYGMADFASNVDLYHHYCLLTVTEYLIPSLPARF